MTPMQRRILWHMREAGEEFAAITGHLARKQGFGVMPAEAGGLIFRAYSDPLYFMRGQGWFEPVERNARGRWYKLTDAGKATAAKVQDPYKRGRA